MSNSFYASCAILYEGETDAVLQCITDKLQAETQKGALDTHTWLLVLSGALLFFMQAGFAVLCAGKLKSVMSIPIAFCSFNRSVSHKDSFALQHILRLCAQEKRTKYNAQELTRRLWSCFGLVYDRLRFRLWSTWVRRYFVYRHWRLFVHWRCRCCLLVFPIRLFSNGCYDCSRNIGGTLSDDRLSALQLVLDRVRLSHIGACHVELVWIPERQAARRSWRGRRH